MKAISLIINFSKVFASLGAALIFNEMAVAHMVSNQDASQVVQQEADGMVVKVDKDGRPYSAIGIAMGLPLYDTDKADTCVPGALQIRVTLHNITPQGLMKLELFGERNFMKSKGKLRRIRVPAEEGPQTVCINLPTTGRYAVVGYHDKNADRKLKKAWNFKPLEPYGLSNNPEIKALRLPKFSETGFDVPLEGVDIDINLVDLTL